MDGRDKPSVRKAMWVHISEISSIAYVREWGAVQSTILVCELDFASNASNKMILSILQLLQVVALATRKVRLERFLSQHA